MPVNPGVPSIGLLRDMGHRLQVPRDLAESISPVTATTAAMEPADARAWVERAIAVTERAIAWLDDESVRVNEQKLAAGDPMSLRGRLVQEPRRAADTAVNAIKAKLGTERGEWNRRVNKQVLVAQEGLEEQLRTLQVAHAITDDAVSVVLDPGWSRAFENWRLEVLGNWGDRVAKLLPDRYARAIDPEVKALGAVLGREIPVNLPAAQTPSPPDREGLRAGDDRFEAPTKVGAVLESFKGGLNTVAMLAGMVVIPVIGSLMHESAIHIRAAVMGGLLVPIAGFAAVAGKKQRAKMLEAGLEKSAEKFRKNLQTEFKAFIDRFKIEIERVVNAYHQDLLATLIPQFEREVAAHFERREREIGPEIARAQSQADKLQDQVGAVRQLRSQLNGQLLVDLRRKQQEIASA